MNPKKNRRWFKQLRFSFLSVVIPFFLLSCMPKNHLVFSYTNEREAGNINILFEELTHRDKYVRQSAAKSLGLVKSDTETVIPPLIGALEDPEFIVRKEALLSLEKLVSPDRKTCKLKMLVSKLKWDGWRVPKEAAAEIGEMGPPAKEAVPSLVRIIENEDNWHPQYCQVKKEAIRALGNIGPEASPAVFYLINSLYATESDIRREAVVALGKIGPRAKAATKGLMDLAENERSLRIRNEATVSLQKILKQKTF